MTMKRLLTSAVLLVCLAFGAEAQNFLQDSLRTAGVRVSSKDGNAFSALQVRVRGVNSLHGSGSPLYIVDGAMLGSSPWTDIDPLSFLSAHEIESVDVLKSASATAMYGSRGADGVVVIKTKDRPAGEASLTWNSDLRLYEPTHSGYARPTFHHEHAFSTGASKDRTSYSLGGHFSDGRYLLPSDGRRYGGLRASFSTKASQAVWFGFNSALSVGRRSSAAGVTEYGTESQTIAMRDIYAAATPWTEDYDDDCLDYRAVTSFSLSVRPFGGFSVDADFGADWRNMVRSFWWGNGTAYGRSMNGAAEIHTSTMFGLNASARVNYARYFAERHHLNVYAGIQALVRMDKHDSKRGSDFFLHDLRVRSLNVMASKAVIDQYRERWSTFGTFAGASYSLASMAGLSTMVRADKTPRYDDGAVLYPGVNLWWDLSETFFPSSEAVSSLRIEAGCGESGRLTFVPYSGIGEYSPEEYADVPGELAAFYEGFSRLHTREADASLSIGLLGDRIMVEAGHYMRSTQDMMTLYRFGAEGEDGLWREAPREEAASHEYMLDNRGYELSLTAVPVRRGGWEWSLTATGTYNDHSHTGPAFVVENPVPNGYGSVCTSLRWKMMRLDAVVDGAAGHDILNLNRMYVDRASSVTPEYIEDGDFVRLARIALSCDVPVSWSRIVRSLNVRLCAGNVLTLTDYSGWTPDVDTYASGGFNLGMDYGSHQQARTWSLSVSLAF